eukprot:15348793-Ditylum_brightwellii.AAC.1
MLRQLAATVRSTCCIMLYMSMRSSSRQMDGDSAALCWCQFGMTEATQWVDCLLANGAADVIGCHCLVLSSTYGCIRLTSQDGRQYMELEL